MFSLFYERTTVTLLSFAILSRVTFQAYYPENFLKNQTSMLQIHTIFQSSEINFIFIEKLVKTVLK